MLNIKELENLRTKEELISYFKSLGKNITEAEIAALKQSYAKTQENGNALTLQQLNDVAGGIILHILDIRTNKEKFSHIVFSFFDNNEPTITVYDYLRHSKADPARHHFGELIILGQLNNGEPHIDENITLEQFFHKYGRAAEYMVGELNSIPSERLLPNTQVLVQRMHDMMSKPDFQENLAKQMFTEPFNTDLRSLQAKHLTGDELGPIGENLMHYFESKKPRVQAFVNMAAMHVTSVGINELGENDGGITSSHNVIKLASKPDEFPQHLHLVHEMAHCLDHRQHCSEHMKSVIESTNICDVIRNTIENYLYKVTDDITDDITDYTVIRLHEITRLLPNPYHRKEDVLCSQELVKDKSVESEIFAKLAEIYVATNGQWKLKIDDAEEANIRNDIPELVNSFETEIQAVFDRAKAAGVVLPPEAATIAVEPDVRPNIMTDVTTVIVGAKTATTSEDPISIPEEFRGEFTGLKTLCSNINTTLTLCEKTTDKTKYIIEENKFLGTQIYKVIKEFENEYKNIYIYVGGVGSFYVCGFLNNWYHQIGSFFKTDLPNKDEFFRKKYPELSGLIMKNVEPFISKYDHYQFNGGNIELNGEVKFKYNGDIKVDVDGVSYDVTEWVSADNPNERVYASNCLILEKKQTAAGEIIYVIPTKNGDYYRYDFKYKTYGEKLLDVPTTVASTTAVKPDEKPASSLLDFPDHTPEATLEFAEN